ncbi:MAG: glycoside hydrolase family 9 protein [Clostridiales bacterium]|nr:glycoside hydrolase family 9 protein [Candidatus Scatonaster coprocaballi]
MKKTVAMLLALSMLTSLVACKKSDDTTASSSESASTETSVESTSDTSESETSATTAVDPNAGKRATRELYDGAYALDESFDDPSTFKWLTYMESGGSYQLNDVDGQMVASIQDVGTVMHACQIFLDGFQIFQNAEYCVEFDIYSDIERDFEWRIQLNGGDYHAYCGEEHAHMGTEPTHISYTFTMYEASDPAPRFAFNLGYQDSMTDPKPHTVYIDNLTMKVLNSSNAVEIEPLEAANPISLNQIGYQPNDAKSVFISNKDDSKFDIIDVKTNEVVYSGELSDDIMCSATLGFVKEGDFTEFNTPGEYLIRTDVTGDSYPFEIADDVYDDALRASVLMLYTQRCGCEVKADIGEEYADFVHPECHMGEAIIYGTEDKIDVSGGWHDAGDYGRYSAPGAKAVADLLMTYKDANYEADDLGIPESGNGVPDILDEARYELEWLFKMQADNGGVYHKVTAPNFPATVMPEEETEQLYVYPISTTATGDFAAVMAKAYGIYAKYDEEFANKCLEASKKAYEYMEANAAADTTGFLNPEGVETGEYPDASNTDEWFWAAIELYLATGEQTYLDRAEELYHDDMELGLGWIEMGLYGIHAYLTSDVADQDAEFKDKLTKRVLDEVSMANMVSRREGYYNRMRAIYPWGSNLTISNNGILYSLAYQISGEEEYRELSGYQVDYILGMNPCGYSFLTAFGDHAAEHPHHRPSQNKGHTVPGMVVGGPNSDPADPYAITVLMDMPGGMCYVDNDQCYSINEVAIYWNSPFIYILAMKANS